MKNLFSSQGFNGFYKGLMPPLSFSSLINAVVFTSYEYSRSILENFDLPKTGYKSIALSGGFAGIINALVVSPVELVKIRMQLQNNSSSTY